MVALIFVIVVAAGILALVIGVQKNKKGQASQEPEVHKEADPINLVVVEEPQLASPEELAALAEAKKAQKAKSVPKLKAEPAAKKPRAKKSNV